MLLIVFFSLLSILMSAYFCCFGYPERGHVRTFDIVMEVSFTLDIVRNFFTEYVDPETLKSIRNFKKIA